MEQITQTNKRAFSSKRKLTEKKEVYIIVQDNLDADSDVIGYSLFLPFITEQSNKDIIVNNKNTKIVGVRRLFGKHVTHIERDENTLVNYVRHIVFTDYRSAQDFIEILSPEGLYKPIIMVGEIPKNKHYFDFKDGILLAETFKLGY